MGLHVVFFFAFVNNLAILQKGWIPDVVIFQSFTINKTWWVPYCNTFSWQKAIEGHPSQKDNMIIYTKYTTKGDLIQQCWFKDESLYICAFKTKSNKINTNKSRMEEATCIWVCLCVWERESERGLGMPFIRGQLLSSYFPALSPVQWIFLCW